MSLALNGGEEGRWGGVGGLGGECYILHRCVTSSNLKLKRLECLNIFSTCCTNVAPQECLVRF